MIGVNREAPSSSGASLSTFGGSINPGGAVPAGVDPGYIMEFAKAHEASGFDKVLLGYSSATAEGFTVAGYAASHTLRLGYLIAHRAGFMAPTLAARMAATLDQLTQGRIAMHLISGGSDIEQQRDGDWLDHGQRYRRTDEYMEILRRMWTENEPFNYDGEFYQLQEAHSQVRPWQLPHIPLFFGGASEDAKSVGAQRADVYALWGEPLAAIREQIADIRGRASEHSREPHFSLSVRPILGATEDQAWQKAHGILDAVKESVGDSIKPGEPARLQSIGSRRLLEFAAQREVHDQRLYMPIAQVSGAAGSTTALVGTAQQVAESMLEYYDLGCTAFIIRGFDPLIDAIEYGKELIPLVREGAARREFGNQV
ncbi:MAG: alkanesulfonate monooxygenase [SAR202 cluster bacterium Io17-Chloro-G9]|nr:MAG: alkanesulfonate monooxygenase [SAR202 cluster bacterium Io17-Chloro-G9]